MSTRRPSALTKARAFGRMFADLATAETSMLVIDTAVGKTSFHDLCELRRKETIPGPEMDETKLFERAARGSEQLLKELTAYSDQRTGAEGAMIDVAFAIGLSLGMALAGKEGVK
jgi:hypothetical protein